MSDRRLEVFYAVARLLSFTKAAEELEMTQPAVTFQIRQIEEQYKARLFDRTHNRISLTDAGRRAFQYAERIFELYAEMENSLQNVVGSISGTLRIAAGAAAAQYMIMPLISEFQKKHPTVLVQLAIRSASRVVTMVENSDVDVGIIEDVVSSKHLKSEPYLKESWLIIASPNQPIVRETHITADKLKAQSWIMMEEGASNREIVVSYLATLGLDAKDLKVAMEVGSLEAIKGALEAGSLLAILPHSAVEKELRLGDLIALKEVKPFVKELRFLYKEQKFPLLIVDELLNLSRAPQQVPSRSKTSTVDKPA
jgi:DNA-binding transcriptional LysR family regulator